MNGQDDYSLLVSQTTPLFAYGSLALGLVAVVLNTRGQRGAIFAPFNLTVLLLLSIFAIRPLYMIASDNFELYGVNVRSGFNVATLIGFLALTSLIFGYLASGRRKAVQVFPDEIFDGSPKNHYSMYKAGLLSLAMNVSWFVVIASRGGGSNFIGTIFDGRNEVTGAALIGLPAFVGALPTAGAIVVGFARISIERQRILLLGERVMFTVVVLASLVPPLALGGRRYLLPCLVAAAIAITARSYRRRIGLRHVGLGLLGFIFLAIVPFVRSTGSRGDSSNILSATLDYFGREGLRGSLEPFFTSYDTEMFNYVALLAPRLGDSIPYGFGRGTIGDALLNPLPASILPFPLWSNRLLQDAFGASCGQGVCPVPSYVGVLFYDLGFIGVVGGSFLLGYACRRYPEWLARATDFRLVGVLGVAAFVPVLVRGNTINLAYIAFSTVVICCVIVRFSHDRSRQEQNRGEEKRSKSRSIRH